MNYPFWDVGIGYGWLMATISVLHVFISHFAIGGGLYLVVVEYLARRDRDAFRLDFLQYASKFFVLATLVTGAVTGVGIWFIIGLLNPAATEALIHHFVWGWATEWTFFVVEIISAILYLYGWKRLSARAHLTIGWIYFAAAWLSLVVINGIITFMLTPGDWLTTGDFWNGFFNPTYWSSLVLRTGICIMLAGVFTMMLASRMKSDPGKPSLVRHNALWGLAGLLVMVPSFYWYWKSIPADITATALQSMATPINAINQSFWIAAALALVIVLFGLILPRSQNMIVGVVMLALAFAWFGKFEWFRESLRKPYIITGYMYGNGVEVADKPLYQLNGYLPQMTFRTGDDGADLFRRSCRTCHTIDGYKPLRPAFDGTDKEFIAAIVMGAHKLKGNMPPFFGTPKEAGLIADHIYGFTDHRPISEIYGLRGVALGEKVYQIRCGGCHVVGGFNDKSASLVGLDDDSYNSLLDIAGELATEMPAFTGDDTERAALIDYFKTLKPQKGATNAGL